MISGFEVGAIFRIIDEASPALRKILAEVRELNKVIDQARANLATLGKSAMPVGLTTAVGETQALARAWQEVAAASALAGRSLTTATAAANTASARSAAAAAATGGYGGGGGGGG